VSENLTNRLPQGMFAGEVGTPRLLKLFKKYDIKTTWFIPGWGRVPAQLPVSTLLTLDKRCFSISPPGHSLDTFPEQMAAVRDAGHEMCVSTSLRNPAPTRHRLPLLHHAEDCTATLTRCVSRGPHHLFNTHTRLLTGRSTPRTPSPCQFNNRKTSSTTPSTSSPSFAAVNPRSDR
jgi:hypothetical protein